MINKVFIIFEDDKTNWWSWLLKKGCRHCYLVKPSPNGYIIHGKRQQGFDLFTVKDQDSIIQNIYAIVDYVPIEKTRPLFMLNTCVGHIKQMLGINNPFILTPYQLLKHIRNQ